MGLLLFTRLLLTRLGKYPAINLEVTVSNDYLFPVINVDKTTRKPMLLLRLSSLLLLRTAHRTLFGLLLNAPPRNTQAAHCSGIPHNG
jgi:hypothetical protein